MDLLRNLSQSDTYCVKVLFVVCSCGQCIVSAGPGSELVLYKVFIYPRCLPVVDCVNKPEVVDPGIFEEVLWIVKPVNKFLNYLNVSCYILFKTIFLIIDPRRLLPHVYGGGLDTRHGLLCHDAAL